MDQIEEKALDFVGRIDVLSDSAYVVALTGSRSCGYATESSDYDFEVLCDAETFDRLANSYNKATTSLGITLIEPTARDQLKMDVTAHRWSDVERALTEWRDEALWIWSNAIAVHDPQQKLADLQSRHTQYPRDVLDRKLKHHFLRDFHLSVHGITYNRDSKNVFSIVHTLSAKIAEYCRISCLLDGKPYPYEKWLLLACEDTSAGQVISLLFHEVIAIITNLGDNLDRYWEEVQRAVKLIDTDACDEVERRLVDWGIPQIWLENAYDQIEQAIYE